MKSLTQIEKENINHSEVLFYQGCSVTECAVILAGSSFNFALHLGILAALHESGLHPDVIIASCGGALAEAIINKFPDCEDQKKYIQSLEFYNLLHKAKLQNDFIPYLLFRLTKMKLQHSLSKFFSYTPDFLDRNIFHISKTLDLPLFDRFFSPTTPRFIMTAGRLIQDHSKFLQEVFFTDVETAKLLKDFPSPIATQFPHSFLKTETATLTDWKFSEAARAAIADPFLLNPFEKEGVLYFSGSIDLYPLELAAKLSQRIIMLYSPLFRSIDQIVLRHFYGYDNIQRYQFITSQTAVERWIDISDYQEFMKNNGFDPQSHYIKGKVVNGTPVDKKEFFRKASAQWDYGWQRAQEALSHPAYSKKHIRKPYNF
ncbi:MAG: patatin-like phospholipase family protein [Deltaproteobacteria bacterium]|nr:patatin-like phospholipase family protein [Deltaproteobacteria bacterium]